MKILFHVAVGNVDRPERWKGVNKIFSDLATTFELLKHECIIWCHKKSKLKKQSYHNTIYSNKIESKIKYIKKFNPDFIFTWNGSSEGDRELVKIFGIEKIVFGELGFFDHYNTLYFSFSGTNANSKILYEKTNHYEEDVINKLVERYKKPRIIDRDYIFVPLQDENDTQITNYSPIKKMEDLLSLVEERWKDDLVLYKKHPHCKIPIKNRKNFVEVYDDVHHYIPYANKVIGINSTVLFETLLYHNNIISFGYGICSKRIESEIERKNFICHCYKKQIRFDDLSNINKIKDSYFYKEIYNKYKRN
jgi:hypothetical protein